MAISFINFSGGGAQGGPFTTVTSSAQNVTSGNSLVIGLRWGASKITDNAGNSYTKLPLVSWPGSFGATLDGAQFFFCNNCVGNSSLQVTGVLPSGPSDTYTVIGVWQFSGGTLIPDQILSTQSNSSSSTQSFTANPHFQQSVVCLIDFQDALGTYGVNSPLTQDGGTSINAAQIASASHVIFNNGFQSQTLSMTSSSSVNWFMPGVIFGVNPQIPKRNKLASIDAAPPMFTGRLYAYYITLERLF